MRLVVIGANAAGLSAASRARRLDRLLDILVLEKGKDVSYGACGLPYYFEGQVRDLDDLRVYSPEYFARERNIRIRTGADVEAILHGRRAVRLASGEDIPYDRLVIATGAAPVPSRIPGSDLPRVFRLHTMQDARRLDSYLTGRQPRRAVIIGASYLGLEVAEALRTRGLEVTIFEASNDVLRRQDPELTGVLRERLQAFRIELRTAYPVSVIEPDRVGGVVCDLVIQSVGLRPNVAAAAEAGIELGRSGAIRVREDLETNLPGVYAAGDCAETTHLVTGKPVWIPLGTTANKMGRVAGANAAGARERFPGIVGTSIIRVMDLGIGMTGLSTTQARREGFDAVSRTVEAKARPRYFPGRSVKVQLVADRSSGRLLGGMVLGEEEVAGRINVIAAALSKGMRVDEFQHLDVAYAPPFSAVWDPLLIAAQQVLPLLHSK